MIGKRLCRALKCGRDHSLIVVLKTFFGRVDLSDLLRYDSTATSNQSFSVRREISHKADFSLSTGYSVEKDSLSRCHHAKWHWNLMAQCHSTILKSPIQGAGGNFEISNIATSAYNATFTGGGTQSHNAHVLRERRHLCQTPRSK